MLTSNDNFGKTSKSRTRRKRPNGIWADIPVGMPPMQRAIKLQKRAASVGFDWPDISQIIDKMHEEARTHR